MDWLQNLSTKIKVVMVIVTALVTVGGAVAGAHHSYAKEVAFQGHLAKHHKEDTKKRIRVLEE